MAAIILKDLVYFSALFTDEKCSLAPIMIVVFIFYSVFSLIYILFLGSGRLLYLIGGLITRLMVMCVLSFREFYFIGELNTYSDSIRISLVLLSI
jgi:hypothetical protein